MKLNQPNFIKVAAVITAAPRWVIALLAAEGFLLPDSWLGWWIIVSALLSLGMAIVEGFAFSYIFNAWRVQKDKASDKLFYIALFSALVFVGVLTPSISAGVRRIPLGELLTEDWTLHLWSIAVALSTIVIVAGVGYAQKQVDNEKPEKQETVAKAQPTQPKKVANKLQGNRAMVLEILQGNPNISQETIAGEVGISRQAVGKHVKFLKENHYLNGQMEKVN